MRYHFQNVNPNKLLIELKNAGVDVLNIESDLTINDIIANNVWFDAEDKDNQFVQQIIDSHDPTPFPEVLNDELLNAKIEVQTINTLIDLGVI